MALLLYHHPQAEAMYYSIDSLAAQLEAIEAAEPVVMEECGESSLPPPLKLQLF